MDEHVGSEPQDEQVDEILDILGNKSTSESDYTGPTHDNICHMDREALVEREENRLRRLIDYRCKKVAIALFQEAQESSVDSLHTPIYEVVVRAAVKAFFTEGADDLLKKEAYKLANSHKFKHDLFRYLIISSTFTVPVPRFCKLQTEKAVASNVKFRQKMSPNIPVKEEVKPASPLTGCFLESPKTSKEEKQERKKKIVSFHPNSKVSSCSKCGSSRHSDNHEVENHDKEPERVKSSSR